VCVKKGERQTLAAALSRAVAPSVARAGRNALRACL